MERGFVPIIITIAAAGVIIIAIITFFIINSPQLPYSQVPQVSQQQSSIHNSSPPSKTASYSIGQFKDNVYTHNEYSFSFLLPDNWRVVANKVNDREDELFVSAVDYPQVADVDSLCPPRFKHHKINLTVMTPGATWGVAYEYLPEEDFYNLEHKLWPTPIGNRIVSMSSLGNKKAIKQVSPGGGITECGDYSSGTSYMVYFKGYIYTLITDTTSPYEKDIYLNNSFDQILSTFKFLD